MSTDTKKSTKMFVNGVLILTISNIIIKAVGLLFKIPIHGYLGDEGMGYFNSAYTIYTWFFMISTAGLPVAMSVLVSKARAKGKFEQVKKILRVSLGLFFVIGALGMTVLILFSGRFADSLPGFLGILNFSEIIGMPPSNLSIIAIAPTLFFVCITSAYRGYFQGHQVMWPTAVSQLLESVGKLFLGILFAKWSIAKGHPLYVTAAYTLLGITIGVFVAMAFIIIVGKLYSADRLNSGIDISEGMISKEVKSTGRILKTLAIIAIPITLSSSVMSLANLIDLILVSNRLQVSGLLPEAAAALYGNYTTLAVPLFNLPPVLVYPIGYSLVPMLSTMVVQKDEKRLQSMMNSSLKVATILSIPCSVGMAALAEPILTMIFNTKENSAAIAAPLLATLAISSFLVSMLAITNAVLQSHKKQNLPLISMLCGAGVKVVASYLLIANPNIRMFGAPISTDICYIIVMVMNFFFCAKYAKLRPNIFQVFVKPLISALICGASAIGTYALCEKLIGHQKLDTVLAIAVAAAVYLAAIIITGCLKKEDFELIPAGGKLYGVLGKLKLIKE